MERPVRFSSAKYDRTAMTKATHATVTGRMAAPLFPSTSQAGTISSASFEPKNSQSIELNSLMESHEKSPATAR